MIRIEPRAQVSPALAIAAPMIAAITVIVLAAIVLAVADVPVRRGYELMWAGAAGSQPAWRATLMHAVPLVLTGLAAALAFRIKLWNLGGEGQFQAGALAALALGSGAFAGPGVMTIASMLAAGALAGALLMLVPVLLKVWRGTDEAVVTLLFNVMMAMLMPVLLAGPQARVSMTLALPKFDWLLGVHAGLLIAIAAVFVIWVALPITVWGFKLRAIAGNAAAARFAGIRVDRMIVGVGLLSGAFAGLAGAMQLVSHAGSMTPGFGAGLGYAGIAVAALAGRSLPAVALAAVFVAALQTGAAALPRDGMHIGNVLVALTLILALLVGMLVRFRLRRLRPQPVTA